MKRIILAVSAVFGLAWMAWAGSITNFPIATTSAPVLPSRSFPNISSAYNGNGASIRGIAVAQVSNAAAKDGSNFTLASQAVGDLPYATSTTALGRIADVAAGSPLISGGVGVVPAYATYLLSGTAAATYTFPTSAKTLAANDGSNFTIASQAVGDLPYATSTTAYGRLGAGAVGAFLMSNGAAAAPSYLTAGAANYLLVGAGVTTIPVWTASTGTGSPVLGTSPSFTTDIHAATAGGAIVGTAALPFSSLYLGNAATNNFQITGTSAAARIVNIPDIAVTGYLPLATATTTTANQILASTTTGGKYTASTSTYANTYVQGGLLHAATANTIAALIPGAVGSFLMSNGTGAALSYLPAGAANYILVGAGVTTIPVWTAPTGTGSPVLGTSPTITTPSITTYEVDGHATVGLTAAQVSSTIVYNTGMGAADVYLTLPTAAAGYSAIFTVGTAQANKWGVRAGTNDKIYLIASDGTVAAGSDNGYARMTAAQVGQSFACWTFKTDAYDWLCKAVSIGTSTFAAN